MSEHQLHSGRSFQYQQRVQKLRERAKRIPTQENLNAILFLIPDQEERRNIFELMEPYLPFPCATCPEGRAQNRAGN